MGFQKLMSRPHESLVATNHGQPHHNKSNRAVTIYQNDITGVVALCIAGDIARCSHVAKTLIFHCGNSRHHRSSVTEFAFAKYKREIAELTQLNRQRQSRYR